jgi:CHAT domain-containing protein
MADTLRATAVVHAGRRSSALSALTLTLAAGLALMLPASAPPLRAQATHSGQASGSPSTLRPEEITADKLLASGKPREALADLDRAANAYRRAGDRVALSRVALKASRARGAFGDLDGAARDAEQARRLSASDPALLLQALTQVARVATDRSDFMRADAALRQALPIAERVGDTRTQATVLRTLAILEDRRGRQREALEHHLQAVSAADRSGDATLRVRTRGTLSGTLLGLSRYDEALANAQEGYDIAQRAPVPALRAAALFDLAQTHAHVWNLDRAAELWAAAIEAYRDTGNLVVAALAMKQSVETWFAFGDFDRAAADGETAVDLLRQTGQVQYIAETAARVALSEVRRGRVAQARIWSDRARAALSNAPESRHLFVHNDLGIVEAEIGDLARSRADFARVLDVARRVGNVEYEWRAHWGQGRAALRDTPTAAVAPLERAIASIERLRQTIPEAGLRASFMINRVGPYETLVEAHMATASAATDQGVRRALEVAERARSRALADLLAEARARVTDPRLAAIRDEESAFGRRFSVVQQRVFSALDDSARAAARGELHDLEREYETLVVRIRRDNPAYASLAHPRPLTAAEIGATLAADEALVEFLMTEKQGFAWVVRRDSIRGYRVPGTKALDPQVRLLTALLAAHDDRATEQLGAHLYATLLGPADASLTGVRRLTIVPDGVLQRLPFALLRSNGRWLVETHTIALAPSATVLQFLRQSRTRAAKPLLALAVPEAHPGHNAIFDGTIRSLGALIHVTDEVQYARQLVGAPPESARSGPAATEGALKSPEAGQYRIVHVAAHAIADEIVPRRSAVLLAPGGDDDGLLQVSEIANLSLNADLVVLAACHSNVGRLVRGEGMLSLSRAFMHGGARAVVAAAWAIPDRETAWLMRRFYSALGEGLAPDEALRQAQLDAIGRAGSRGSPATWAAFVVFGDARSPILDARPRSTAWLLSLLGGAIAAGAIAAAVRRRSKS